MAGSSPAAPRATGLGPVHKAEETSDDPDAGFEDARARVLAANKREEREEAWRFKRAQDRARLEREVERARLHRLRADKAERDADNVQPLAHERATDAEAAAEARRDRAATSELAARTRLREAVTRREEVEADCARRLQEAQTLLAQEQAHTAEVEALLERARQGSAVRWEHAAAAEERASARRAALDAEADGEAARAEQREAAAQEALGARELEVRQRCEAEVQAARGRLAQVRELCRERVDLEAARKARAEEVARERLGMASARLTVDETCAQQVLAGLRQDCEGLVSRAQAREEVRSSAVEVGTARLWEAAAAKGCAAQQRDAISKASLQSSVFVLGGHHATTREYTPVVDERISGILQGRLHGGGSKPAPRSWQPSPRSLPPPDPMARW